MCQFIETIRIEDGQVYNLSYHTARMNRTRAAFWKEAAPIDLSGFISPPSLSGIWKCRIVYDKEIEAGIPINTIGTIFGLDSPDCFIEQRT